jgi:tRNA(Ile)-lysidine synthase
MGPRREAGPKGPRREAGPKGPRREAGPKGPDAAVAAVRLGVRRSLTGLTSRESSPDGPLVLVACSGGPDSLALAAAVAFEAPRLGVRAGAVTVDHGLQEGSAEQASRVAATLRGLGLDPVACVRADVAGPGAARP